MTPPRTFTWPALTWPALTAIVLGLATATQPAAATTFKHVVIIFQENRTPDNLFGSNPKFEPGVDIVTSGPTSHGQMVTFTPEPLAGCYDVSHTHNSFELALNQGADREPTKKNSGCVLPANPQYKYADNSTGNVQPYFDLATNYGFANRMFQTNQGPSYPAHQFIFGATSAPTTDTPLFVAENTAYSKETAGCIAPAGQGVYLIDQYGSETSNPPIAPCFEHPTLSDVLNTAGISWHYYSPSAGGIWTAPNSINHICQPALVGGVATCTGPDWANGNVVPNNSAQVLTDVANCNLAAVSWVIPTSKESDHASITDGTGPQWVATVVNAIGNQATCPNGEKYWQDTAIFITWDDWGGWYDHVRPPVIRVSPTSPPAWGNGYVGGFRVPLIVVSAYTPAGYVNNKPYDFGSILYFIEQNFNLGFIGPGTDIYTQYDDYHAQTNGKLTDFFTLATPRSFTPIATTKTARYFLSQPHDPNDAPDDE